MKSLLTIALTALSVLTFGQGRLVLNNDVFITYDVTGGPAYVVVDNPNANGIQTLGTGGNIVSENEDARVKWNVKNTNATYVVPFTNTSGTKIPVTVDITTVGSNDGDLVFATYLGPTWDNNTYRPSDVTHMFDWLTNSINNSGYVIDRFWIIDPSEALYAYTTKPDVDITFSFDPTDIYAGNVFISPAVHNFGAQRFNNGPNLWGDLLPIGAELGNTVTGVTVGNADFYRSWTLVDYASPLPIELADFDAQCIDNSVMLRWYTVSETNNETFSLEKSTNGVEFIEITSIPGAINSNTVLSYSFLDENANGLSYYRIKQIDIDGTFTYSDVITSNCGEFNGVEIVTAYEGNADQLNIVISSTFEANFNLEVMDMSGKVVISQPSTFIGEGMTNIGLDKSLLSTGIYLIRLHNESDVMSHKVMLK